MGLQDRVAIVSVVVAVVATGITVHVARIQNRRNDFELARSPHADLTGGVVAQARDRLGTMVLGGVGEREGLPDEEIRQAYFTLLWCFERVRAGRCSLMAGHSRPSAAVRYLDGLIAWHVGIWSTGLTRVRKGLEQRTRNPIDDQHSRAAFDLLLKDLFADDADTRLAALGLPARLQA